MMMNMVHSVSGRLAMTSPQSHSQIAPIIAKRTHTPAGTVRFGWVLDCFLCLLLTLIVCGE